MAKNFAVCIGINHYVNMPELRCAKRDAEKMRDWFETEAGFEKIYLFTDNSPPITDTDASKPYPSQPTYGTLIRFLDNRFEKPFLSVGDNLWFFFSGHGIRHTNRDYLMLSDSSATGSLIEKTAISLSYVTERLRRCGADNVILIQDACRNEGSLKGLGIGEEKHKGVITIASCSPSERSFEIEELENGSFTYALLESLRITGTENCATVERLDKRLRYRVPELNKKYKKDIQTPYVIPEPLSKSQLILLPSQATRQDISVLREEAHRAKNNNDLELAKMFMTQVLIVSPADPDALAWFKEIWVEELKWQHKFEIRAFEKSQETKIQELEKSYQSQRQQLEQSFQAQIKQLEQQLEQERSQASEQQANLQSSIKAAQEELTKKQLENAQLLERISRLHEQLQSSSKVAVTKEVELKNEKGIDYTKLRDLLAAGKWKEADQETAKVMCQAAGRESEGYVRTEDIDNFPCEDLRTINQLWLHYSNGKFGFSVQKEIYESLGGTREYNDEVWKKFCDRVGWRKKERGNWLFHSDLLLYSDLTFNRKLAPQAHLPGLLWGLVGVSTPEKFSRAGSLLSRKDLKVLSKHPGKVLLEGIHRLFPNSLTDMTTDN